MLPGFTTVVVILATDAEGITRFFQPKEYNTSEDGHKEEFLKDVHSITAGNDGKGVGGDVPEYGMSGVLRCIRKSLRYPDTRALSHIILITDAPAKDHHKKDLVQRLLRSVDPRDLVVHGFLPESLLDPLPGSCLASPNALASCYLKSGIPYKEIIDKNEGILVRSIAFPTASGAFVSKYNTDYIKSVPSLTCIGRKKRLVSSCHEFPVLTITKKVTVIVHPSSALAIVVRHSNNTGSEEFFRNKGEAAILVWNNPKPNGTWSVCINDSTDVDIKVENNFQFTVDFLKSDEDEEQPLLSVLPPPGCPVNVAVFTPQIGNLSCTEIHALEVICSSSNQEKGKLECCGSYLHGTIILPTDSFSFRFHGITSDGHSFESEQVMRHQATRWTLLLSTVHAPSQISRGSSADYVFNVKAASVWPNCSVSVRIDATTLLQGVELEVKPNVVTLDGASPVSFRIIVTATEEATAGQGFMEVAFSAEGDGTPINSSRVSIGIEVCVIRNCTY